MARAGRPLLPPYIYFCIAQRYPSSRHWLAIYRNAGTRSVIICNSGYMMVLHIWLRLCFARIFYCELSMSINIWTIETEGYLPSRKARFLVDCEVSDEIVLWFLRNRCNRNYSVMQHYYELNRIFWAKFCCYNKYSNISMGMFFFQYNHADLL